MLLTVVHTVPGSKPKDGLVWLVGGTGAILAAVFGALFINWANNRFPNAPETAVNLVAGVFVLGFVVFTLSLFVFHGGRLPTDRLGIACLGFVLVMLVSVYLYVSVVYTFFPADILIWSEGDFINDILKFHLGHPLYTAEQNNESFTYPPGSPILTHGIASLVGCGGSIWCYRAIQLLYTTLAAVVAVCCVQRLLVLSGNENVRALTPGWRLVILLFAFLVATNPLTNPFVHNLHNDALAQLIMISGYWLLLDYALRRRAITLAIMSLLPVVGFLVKQSLVIWAPVYAAQLILFDTPRSLPRLAAFSAACIGGLVATLVLGWSLWRQDFIYWVFTVLARHHVLLLRSVHHLIEAWVYYAMGLIGGWTMLRGAAVRRLMGPWLVWLFILMLETYTSGIAWMLNHLGPGCLIGGAWFLAALPRLWPRTRLVSVASNQARPTVRVVGALSLICLLCAGLGFVRIPLRPIPIDAYRYVREIEQEFTSGQSDTILLDVGTWVYFKQGIVMKDRAPTVGERGYSGTGDFSALVQRLSERHYSRILVRNLHSDDFWYDHASWPASSGIRRALLDNYEEISVIKGVDHDHRYGFASISVLVPKCKEVTTFRSSSRGEVTR
jgi:hypothetical protein